KEPDMNLTILDPKLLGFWAKCVRETQHLSQDALAVNAGVTIRTVQRFEAGQAVNVTSRRALAKALGYDNPDAFDDLKFIDGLLQDLREKGARVYSATRDRKFRGADWGDKPSLEMTTGCLAIVPADREISELYIPRKTRFA